VSAVILHMTVSGIGALKVVTRRLTDGNYHVDSEAQGSVWRVRARGSRALSSDEFRALMSEVMAVDGAIYEYTVESEPG
jgi:hypothetical protein